MKRMPERDRECIALVSLIAKQCFVPGGSLFSRAYQPPDLFFFFFLPPPDNLLELQVFQFKEMNPHRIHKQCRLHGIQARPLQQN